VVGPLLGAQPGESLRLRGRWTSHPQYGRQFQVDTYQTMLPAMAGWVTEARSSGVRLRLGGGQRVHLILVDSRSSTTSGKAG
jgi:exodeoxyribonuclease V alpha subunit